MALTHIRDATPLPVLLQLPHIRDATPLPVLLQLPHIRDATLGWGGLDNWWKLFKATVPNSIPTTKGSMKVNRKIFRYVRSFQWRWENPRELLKTTATFIKQHQATVLIRLWASSRRKNAERVVDRKVKPSRSETPFFSQN